MGRTSRLTPSLEDYLEAILALEKENRVARVKDIAARLGVQMPSVTSALKILRTRSYLNYEKNSFISLTEKGVKIAESIQRRHTILKEFLEHVLLLSPADAQDQACKIEHSIDARTAERLANCTDFIEEVVFVRDGFSGRQWREIITGSSGEDEG